MNMGFVPRSWNVSSMSVVLTLLVPNNSFIIFLQEDNPLPTTQYSPCGTY